jgi:hypothetical protein
VPTRRHASDVDAGVSGVSGHAHPVAQDGASRERAGGIDSDDPHSQTRSPDLHGQRIDQSALSGPGRTGDANEIRTPGAWVNLPNQRRGLRRLVLDQRDRTGNGASIAGKYRVDERLAKRQAAAAR